MDTGSIARIPAVPAPSTAPRGDAVQAARGVATELPADAAVQQAGEAAATRFDSSRAPGAAVDQGPSELVRRKVEIDPRTREVVFQVIDRETDRVMRQTPDEAILRLRAYIREMQAAQESARGSGPRIEKIA
jgi:hypothetical protein